MEINGVSQYAAQSANILQPAQTPANDPTTARAQNRDTQSGQPTTDTVTISAAARDALRAEEAGESAQQDTRESQTGAQESQGA